MSSKSITKNRLHLAIALWLISSLCTGVAAATNQPGSLPKPLKVLSIIHSEKIQQRHAIDHLPETSNSLNAADTPLEFRSSNHKTLEETRITIRALGHDYVLQLAPSHTVSQNLITQSIEANDHLHELMVLAGNVIDDPTSWARVTLINGILHGTLKLDGALYNISQEELSDADARSASTNNSYQLTQLGQPTARNPLANRSLHNNRIDLLKLAPPPLIATPPQRVHHRMTNNPVHTAIRIGIVIDSLFNEHHEGNGHAKALSIINTVDGIYQDQLGVAVVLESLVLYDDPASDPLRELDGNIDDFLNAFRDIRLNEPRLKDDLTLVHLLTGLRDPDNVIGLGWIGTACRTDGYDVSMSAPFAFDGLLTAHEMAHNLGALHDDQTSCPGEARDIMWPRLSSQTTTNFSACSKQAMSAGISASCNIDNIDMSIGLAVLATDIELQYRLSVMVTNNDSNRSVDSVSSMIRIPAGSEVSFQDSRCDMESEGVHCLHGSVLANNTDVIHMLITYPDDVQQMIIADILPAEYSDVNSTNNRATLAFKPSNDGGGGATFEPEPVAIPSADQAQNSGGTGAVLWLLMFLSIQQISRAFGSRTIA